MSHPDNEATASTTVAAARTPTKRSKSSVSESSEPKHKSPRKSRQTSASTPAANATIVTPSTTASASTKPAATKSQARRSLTQAIVEETEKKLPFGGTSKPIEVAPNVKRVYTIVNKHTGSIGGNSHGGAIYGELTVGSMQKMVNLMVEHTNLGPDSRFIDVGCGLGKPNLHVVQNPGVEFSYGIEMEHTRWMLGIANLAQVLKQAKVDEVEGRTEDLIGHACVLEHGDIRDAKFFDPFTHVYMFDIGFPPRLFHILAEMFNNSSSQYLICYHGPRLMIDTYEFNVELITKTSTTMHGSSEVHSGYIYKRTANNKSKCKSKTFGEACDPLFSEAWKICRGGLDTVLRNTEEQVEEHIRNTNQRVTRSAARRSSSN